MHQKDRFSMPPAPGVWGRRRTVVQESIDEGFGSESVAGTRCVVTQATGQSAVAGYGHKPGDAVCERVAIDVLRVHDEAVTEIVTLEGAAFKHFDLPATLGAEAGAR